MTTADSIPAVAIIAITIRGETKYIHHASNSFEETRLVEAIEDASLFVLSKATRIASTFATYIADSEWWEMSNSEEEYDADAMVNGFAWWDVQKDDGGGLPVGSVIDVIQMTAQPASLSLTVLSPNAQSS